MGNINQKEVALALVSFFSDPDPQLLEESFQTLYSVTAPSEEDLYGLQVIQAKQISAVVAVIPYGELDIGDEAKTYFIWEKMGMDMASYADVLVPDDDDDGEEEVD